MKVGGAANTTKVLKNCVKTVDFFKDTVYTKNS